MPIRLNAHPAQDDNPTPGTVARVDLTTELSFGWGDIHVAPATYLPPGDKGDAKDGYPVIVFARQDPPGEVGGDGRPDLAETYTDAPPVVMGFHNPESIDALVKTLLEYKEAQFPRHQRFGDDWNTRIYTRETFNITTLADLFSLPTYDMVVRACGEFAVLLPQLRALHDAYLAVAQTTAEQENKPLPDGLLRHNLVLPVPWIDDEGGTTNGAMNAFGGAPLLKMDVDWVPYSQRPGGDKAATPPPVDHMVCGFLFRAHPADPRRIADVALVRKSKPDWMRGKLNGVGGHVEPGESLIEAMHREFQEETKLPAQEWTPFLRLVGVWGVAHFFRAFAASDVGEPQGLPDEPVNWYPVPQVWEQRGNSAMLVPNLRWMIAQALDEGTTGTMLVLK